MGLISDSTCGQCWESWIPWGGEVTQGRGEGGDKGVWGGDGGLSEEGGGDEGRRGGAGLSLGRSGKTALMENPDPVENCLRFASSLSKTDLSWRCHKREQNFLHHIWKHFLNLQKNLCFSKFYNFEPPSTFDFLILQLQHQLKRRVKSQPREMLFPTSGFCWHQPASIHSTSRQHYSTSRQHYCTT